jgi:hypothetical protein
MTISAGQGHDLGEDNADGTVRTEAVQRHSSLTGCEARHQDWIGAAPAPDPRNPALAFRRCIE